MPAPDLLSASQTFREGAAVAGPLAAPSRDREIWLVARIADGERDALDEVVQANFRKSFCVARRILGDDAEAEDMTQEAFLKLWRSPPVLSEDGARLSTWLYRVTTNLCIDFIRKRRPDQLEEGFDMASEEAGAEDKVSKRQVADAVDAALKLLPVRQRTALVLTYYEGLSNREASEVLDITVEALESLLARARRSLKQHLETYWRDMLDTLETACP